MLTQRYRKALERIASLDGIKSCEGDLMTASSNLFALVCKLKNIAKDALDIDDSLIDQNTIDIQSMSSIEIPREYGDDLPPIVIYKKDPP